MKKIFTVLLFAVLLLPYTVCIAQGAQTTKENGAVNFETKKNEIIETLKLNEKQQLKAEKMYTSAKEKVTSLSAKIQAKHKEVKNVKLSGADDKTKLDKMIRLNAELDALYRERDRVKNRTLRRFERLLNKEQKQTWNEIKRLGARIFPEE